MRLPIPSSRPSYLVMASLVLANAGPARADPVMVRAEAQTLSVDCAGADAEVAGSRNTVTFAGACRSLTLRGDANKVAIDLASGARLDVEGNDNTIRYTIAGGREPNVRVSGSGTDLSATGAAPSPGQSADPVTLTGDNQRLDLDCTGRDVTIQGNRSRYVLRGGCRSLSAHGEGNAIQAELLPQAKVEIEGNGTTLSYRVAGTGADPDIVVRGANSQAVRVAGLDARPPATAAPPPRPPAAASLSPPVTGAPGTPPQTTPSPATPAPATTAPAAPQTPPSATASPPPAPAATPSVPVLMHDLPGKVVENGTVVSFPADALFAGNALQDAAADRLRMLAALIAQVHPSGVRITSFVPDDLDLARARSRSVQAWLTERGQIRAKMQTVETRGTPARVEILILR